MFHLDISLNTFTRLPNIGKTLVTPRVLLHEGFSLSISALHTNQGLVGKVECFKHIILSSYVQFCHWLQFLSEVHTPKVFHFTAWTNYVRIDDLRTRHVSTLKVTTWEKTGSVRFHGRKCWSLPLTNKLTFDHDVQTRFHVTRCMRQCCAVLRPATHKPNLVASPVERCHPKARVAAP